MTCGLPAVHLKIGCMRILSLALALALAGPAAYAAHRPRPATHSKASKPKKFKQPKFKRPKAGKFPRQRRSH